MSIRIDIKRTSFYQELTPELQNKYFKVTGKKYLPTIDNIYYNLYIKGDYNGNSRLELFLSHLETLKNNAKSNHAPEPLTDDLSVTHFGTRDYKFCLSNSDLYDIFITDYLPNRETPRVQVQIRAFGLWTHSIEKMISDSYKQVVDLFSPYDVSFNLCKENRIDFCFHTNEIHSPEKIFIESKLIDEMSTTLTRWQKVGRIEKGEGKNKLHNDYIALGNRKSNNIFIRIYNKGLEVVEGGYKGFFLDIWHKNNLISFYDKYVLEKAYIEKNWNTIHKYKLEFYQEYGTNEETKEKIKNLLENPKATTARFKKLAGELMPELTTVLNIEFETKRKFYYYSDDFIDETLQAKKRADTPDILDRIYKIVDNRKVFLDYLTSRTIAFKKKGKYASWWKRLRSVKHDGIKTDEELLRKYSQNLDDKMAKLKFINSVASKAVYDNKLDTDFQSDASDMLSNLNDNDKKMLEKYSTIKARKEERLKNRKSES